MKPSIYTPDCILYHGHFLSMNDQDDVYNGVAIQDGRIVDVFRAGDALPKQGFGTKCVDMQGKTVIPGFIDCNVHVVQTGVDPFCAHIAADSKAEFLEVLGELASHYQEGELIWCTNTLEHIKLDRGDLDRVAPEHPVVVSRSEFHTTVVNTGAYNILGIPSFVDGVEKSAAGIPTGVLRGTASGMARRKAYQLGLTPKLRKTAIGNAIQQMLQVGITTANAMEGGAFFSDADIEAVHEAAETSAPDLLVYPQIMDVDKVLRLGLPRIGGNIYLDGTIGSRTAAVQENYRETAQNGLLYYTPEDIDKFVRNAHQCGLQVSISCVGERAIEQALHAFQMVLGSSDENPLRHRLELFVLPTEAQIRRAVRLGLLLSIRPNYDRLWGGADGMYARHMGEAYLRANPLASLMRLGGRVLLGSESGVTPLNPLLGIQSCVTHHVPQERLSVLEALKMYTVNGAYANFLEHAVGKIERGFYADLAVLSQDPLTAAVTNLEQIKVLKTFKRGQLVYDRGGE